VKSLNKDVFITGAVRGTGKSFAEAFALEVNGGQYIN
jgi:NAD(P)-dependent dehydrogenase (short-subunit alcohol dehydrogenase family)